MGLSNELSCEAGSFSYCHLNPHKCFQSEALRLHFPALEPWVAQSVLLPNCFSQFICTQMWDHQLPPHPSGTLVATLRCILSTMSLPLLPVWMNVSSLIPWSLDFHTVQFSGSSAYFLFLNLLLSFFWLCKETKYI